MLSRIVIKRKLTAELLSRYSVFPEVLEGKPRDGWGQNVSYEKEMGAEKGKVENVDKRKKEESEKREVKENAWKEEVRTRKRGVSSRTRQNSGV